MTIPSIDPAAAGAPPRIERCRACAHAWLTPRGFCPRCGADDASTEDITGVGRVEAVTVVHRAAQPSAVGPAPYTIALVAAEAAPGLRFMALAPGPVAVGDRVRVTRHGDRGAPYLVAREAAFRDGTLEQ
ncbi:OB-fold domain-containing protein [Aquisalimonas lutea]|uniref:Zn-ribbon domain-containing OB-fold protein n=1 Tax=Aquisalimonas lutea TaxID=1327750 RepID=UPI0025B4ED32|nr:OB-fold domain-containing protein [Aquisalimonas lutea]MDN3516560.1 OB-fold domain-containing protein [Aquisalimonas lutea]